MGPITMYSAKDLGEKN